MTDDDTPYVEAIVDFVPREGRRTERRIECPECDRLLPPDTVTECDRCGAHLTLCWRVDAPSVGGEDG